MSVIELIIEILFYGFCGWIGHVVVKLLTFGKVDLDYGDSSESMVAELIGSVIFVMVVILTAVLLSRFR